MRKTHLAIPGAIALVLALGACAQDGGSTEAPDSGEVTPITVLTAPAIVNVSLYYAMEGAFADNGLEATPQVVASGQQAVPLLLNGQAQFGATDPVAAINALNQDVPIVIVAPGDYLESGDKDATGLLVDPSIKSVDDLGGKTIAVNAIGGYLQISAQSVIDEQGGDSSGVNFVAMAIPDMVAAIKAHTVDGGVVPEPFLNTGVAGGLTNLTGVAGTALPKVPQVVYIASKDYAQKNPKVVEAFAAALVESAKFLNENPDKLREVAVTSTGAPAEALANANLPIFSTEPMTLDDLDKVQELMVKYGQLDKVGDVSGLFLSGN